MSELSEKLKDLLKIEDLAREAVPDLKGHGRKLVGLCPMHEEKSPSFNVNVDEGFFKCFGCGAGGDVLSLLGWILLKKTKLSGDDFVEVLREGCKRCGIDFDAQTKDPQALARIGLQRQKEGVLELYVQVAVKSWTGEAFERFKHLKPWVGMNIVDAWRIGYAPTVEQLHAGGVSEKSLKLVGLLRESSNGGAPYLHFRDSAVIPWIERGRVVFLNDRDLSGTRQRDGKPLKSLSMYAPQKDGTGGMPRPACFNPDAIYGVKA